MLGKVHRETLQDVRVDKSGGVSVRGGGGRIGRWEAAGALTVSVCGAVKQEDWFLWMLGHDPATGEQLGRPYAVGGWYYDGLGVRRRRSTVLAITAALSAPKSVSAAWALSEEKVRREIEGAMGESSRALVGFLQTHAVRSRRRRQGTERIGVAAGATVASFERFVGVAGDPQLETLLVWGNRVLCDDGEWRALYGRPMYRCAKPAGELGGAVLRAAITRRLGWQWEGRDIAGVPSEVREMWSKRQQAIKAAAPGLVDQYEASIGREVTAKESELLRHRAGIKTHRSIPDVDLVEEHRRWRGEAAALGYSPEDLVRSLSR